MRSTGRFFVMAALLAISAPAGARAQTDPLGPEEGYGRGVVIQFGAGFTVPMAHLAAQEDVLDGFAGTAGSVNLRAYIPMTTTLDLMIDLAIPRFQVDSDLFERVTNVDIAEPSYRGNALSFGGRWIPLTTAWGAAYVTAAAGMYHLVFDRFLGGVQTLTRGAYRLGGSGGLGVRVNNSLADLDLTVRTHRFTDTGNFGLGDLSWMEVTLLVNFDLGRER